MKQQLKLIHTSGFPLGTAVQQHDGWRFHPNVSGRRGSIKGWPTANACLPKWAITHLRNKTATFDEPVDCLSRSVLIHVCKDRTLTYRERSQPVFNGVAIPVFSVDTVEQAKRLIVLIGSKQYGKHPLLPLDSWYKINIDSAKQYLEIDDLDAVTARIAVYFERMMAK